VCSTTLLRDWLNDLADGKLFSELEYINMSHENKARVVALAIAMLKQFQSRWGTVTLFNKEIVRGNRRIRVGIPKTTFFAAALDPRTKGLDFMEPEEQTKLWSALEEELLVEYHKQRPVDLTTSSEMTTTSTAVSTPSLISILTCKAVSSTTFSSSEVDYHTSETVTPNP